MNSVRWRDGHTGTGSCFMVTEIGIVAAEKETNVCGEVTHFWHSIRPMEIHSTRDECWISVDLVDGGWCLSPARCSGFQNWTLAFRPAHNTFSSLFALRTVHHAPSTHIILFSSCLTNTAFRFMEVGFEGCLDMLMLCACCLLLCTLKHTHRDTHTHITHTQLVFPQKLGTYLTDSILLKHSLLMDRNPSTVGQSHRRLSPQTIFPTTTYPLHQRRPKPYTLYPIYHPPRRQSSPNDSWPHQHVVLYSLYPTNSESPPTDSLA